MDDGDLFYLGEQAVTSVKMEKHSTRSRLIFTHARIITPGLVFQNFNLFPHYTVLKNIMDAPVRVQKRNKAEVKGTGIEAFGQDGAGR